MARKKHHETMFKTKQHSVKEMQADYDKYGDASFSFEVLEHCKSEELVEHELKWQERYADKYNLSTGGSGRYRGKSVKMQNTIYEGDVHISGNTRKMFWMRSPTGISYVFPSIYSASKHIGVHKERVRHVVLGKSRTCSGWTMMNY